MELHKPIPPLVAEVLKKIAVLAGGEEPTEATLLTMRDEFDSLHPYGIAKKYGVLVDNSGEELALQFMPYYNKYEYRY